MVDNLIAYQGPVERAVGRDNQTTEKNGRTAAKAMVNDSSVCVWFYDLVFDVVLPSFGRNSVVVHSVYHNRKKRNSRKRRFAACAANHFTV